MSSFIAFDYKLPVNQYSSVELWESCTKKKNIGFIGPWVSIRERGPEILKHGVPRWFKKQPIFGSKQLVAKMRI